jgi:cell division protein FtsB
MSEAYKSHESVLTAYEWVQTEGINPEIENSLHLDDILIQASDEIQALKARAKELEAENERLKNQSMWGDYE